MSSPPRSAIWLWILRPLLGGKVKSLMLLWQKVAEEFGDRCSVSTSRDVKTVSVRVEHEGLSFLGITLPAFGKDFEKSLSTGCVAPNSFPGFARRAGLPQFLGGFLELVFDRASGRLLGDPSIDSIHAVRQLTLLFGKMELLTSEKREKAAMGGFIECEKELKIADAQRPSHYYEEFSKVSTILWSDVLCQVDKDLYEEFRQVGLSSRDQDWPYVRPQHGPGATADRKSGNGKYDFCEWTDRLERIFPFVEYALPNWGYYNNLQHVDFLGPGAERPVRVISVPKTLKTPRLIAIEPSYMQYVQQGIKRLVVSHIQAHKAMGMIVGFDDQHRNHELARLGSLDGSLATLDLSEASDRVSNQLVRTLVKNQPLMAEALDATRSRKADVSGHGVIRLAKYASMGSALTFPIEAMVFATVVFVGVQRTLGRPLTTQDVLSLSKRVRVYGDDIIVPVIYAQSVIEALEDFGLKVNLDKSFVNGSFRESCGKEYYNGHDVSIVRVRKIVNDGDFTGFPTKRKYVHEVVSFVNLRNRFYLAGLWRTAGWLDTLIGPLLGVYPRQSVRPIDPDKDPEAKSRVLGRYSFLVPSVHGTNGDLQVPVHKGWTLAERLPNSEASHVGALLKVLSPRDEPFEQEDHLVRAGRPDAARSKLKLRWSALL